jgi:DNA-binding CsgD family transcriptional regulator
MRAQQDHDVPDDLPPGLRATTLEVDGERLLVLSYDEGDGAALDRDAFAGLTAAEREVVARVLAGWPSARIASDRGRSVSTVNKQIENAYRKLGVASRAELASRAAAARRPASPKR